MKNIYLIPTKIDEGRLFMDSIDNKLVVKSYNSNIIFKDCEYYNLFITSDEEIKEGDWCHTEGTSLFNSQIGRVTKKVIEDNGRYGIVFKKIILTTNPDLIKDGVQAIDDEFLEWFVNNSSCEFVEVEKTMYMPFDGKVAFELSLDESLNTRPYYKIIIPKEEPKQLTDLEIAIKLEEIQRKEPKQETLEEAAERLYQGNEVRDVDIDEDLQIAFIKGVKWQAERMYSEEEVLKIVHDYRNHFELYRNIQVLPDMFFKWFEQFKKK